MEIKEKYQYFWIEKSALTSAMDSEMLSNKVHSTLTYQKKCCQYWYASELSKKNKAKVYLCLVASRTYSISLSLRCFGHNIWQVVSCPLLSTFNCHAKGYSRCPKILNILFNIFGLNFTFVCLFVCVEVLRPSQPSGVMSSAVSLPNHTFNGQA